MALKAGRNISNNECKYSHIKVRYLLFVSTINVPFPFLLYHSIETHHSTIPLSSHNSQAHRDPSRTPGVLLIPSFPGELRLSINPLI